MNAPALAELDGLPELLAAELASTAYAFTLERGLGDHWLQLELELWRALCEIVDQRIHAEGHDDYIAHLAEAAYRTVLRFGVNGSFVDVELGIHEAFRAVLEAKASGGAIVAVA